ncbi:MAG: hypothetical protein NPIRA04_03210 [Nitrospirales bacterium]|nr:MAG: hypothetical protein NPIRA04_03210 [Nitrospirales bacterium]
MDTDDKQTHLPPLNFETDLAEPLRSEWEDLARTLQSAHDSGTSLDASFKCRLRRFYDRLVSSLGFCGKPVCCSQCQRRLDGMRVTGEDCDDPDTWELQFDAKQSVPEIWYVCLQCGRKVRQEYEIVH